MADVQAILGNPPKPVDPLAQISGYQQLANQVAQNQLTQQQTQNALLANQTGQQELGQKMAMRHAQVMAGLLTLPEGQLAGGAQKALDDELATGQLDQQRYNVLKQNIADNANNPTALKQQILSGLIGNLAGPEALKALTPGLQMLNIGGQEVPLQTPSQAGMVGGALNISPQAGITIGGGPIINRSLAPGLQDVGGQIVPVGGAAGSPTLTRTLPPQVEDVGGAKQVIGGAYGTPTSLTKTLTPEGGVALQQQLVKNPDGTYSVQSGNVGQLYPGVAPKGLSVGSGNYPGPQTQNIPVGKTEQIAKNTDQFTTDQQAVPALQTGTQSLGKALDALNAVATGAGTEGLARMRSYAMSLANVLLPNQLQQLTGGVNIQDMSRAELTKYLTDYARQSGLAGRSDAALESAFKANASGEINNAAAQDVVRTNIGRDRQTIAATMTSNPQTHNEYKQNFSNTTDPRGFAWDTYTEPQKQQILKEVDPHNTHDTPEYKKLARAIGNAQKLGMLNFNKQQPANVNVSAP